MTVHFGQGAHTRDTREVTGRELQESSKGGRPPKEEDNLLQAKGVNHGENAGSSAPGRGSAGRGCLAHWPVCCLAVRQREEPRIFLLP